MTRGGFVGPIDPERSGESSPITQFTVPAAGVLAVGQLAHDRQVVVVAVLERRGCRCTSAAGCPGPLVSMLAAGAICTARSPRPAPRCRCRRVAVPNACLVGSWYPTAYPGGVPFPSVRNVKVTTSRQPCGTGGRVGEERRRGRPDRRDRWWSTRRRSGTGRSRGGDRRHRRVSWVPTLVVLDDPCIGPATRQPASTDASRATATTRSASSGGYPGPSLLLARAGRPPEVR